MIVSKIDYSVLIFDKDSSTFETIRYCSLIGGNGIKRPFIAFCDIFFMDSDVPLAAALTVEGHGRQIGDYAVISDRKE